MIVASGGRGGTAAGSRTSTVPLRPEGRREIMTIAAVGETYPLIMTRKIA